MPLSLGKQPKLVPNCLVDFNYNYHEMFEWGSLGTARPLPSSDYRPIPHLDIYEDENLDERDFDSMSPGARAAAERALRKRDRQEALASGRMRPGLLYEESEDDELRPPLARRRRTAERAAEEGMEFEEVCVCVCVCV